MTSGSDLESLSIRTDNRRLMVYTFHRTTPHRSKTMSRLEGVLGTRDVGVQFAAIGDVINHVTVCYQRTSASYSFMSTYTDWRV